MLPLPAHPEMSLEISSGIIAVLASVVLASAQDGQTEARPTAGKGVTQALAKLGNQGYTLRRSTWSGTLQSGLEYELPTSLCAGNTYGILLHFANENQTADVTVIDENGVQLETSATVINTQTLLLEFTAEYSGIYKLLFSTSRAEEPFKASVRVLYK